MVDVRTAEHNGVCPTCEGYTGGGVEDDDCPNELCTGSCPACRCPGCHDGQTGDPQTARAFGIDPEDYPGSWPAYLAVNPSAAEPAPQAETLFDSAT